MASIRIIKKDINYLTLEVATYCFYHIEQNPKVEKKETVAIINDSISLRNQMIERVNQLNPSADKKETKAYFHNLIADLSDEIQRLYERLEKTIPTKE